MGSPGGCSAFGKRVLPGASPRGRRAASARPGLSSSCSSWVWHSHEPCPGSGHRELPWLLWELVLCPLSSSRCLSAVQELLTRASVVTCPGAALHVPTALPRLFLTLELTVTLGWGRDALGGHSRRGTGAGAAPLLEDHVQLHFPCALCGSRAGPGCAGGGHGCPWPWGGSWHRGQPACTCDRKGKCFLREVALD